MRNYPKDSPQAAARIIALTVVADGEIDQVELDLLERLGVDALLGLKSGALQDVLDTFCEDLLSSHQLQTSDICPVDDATLAHLLDEISKPALREQLLKLCMDIAASDSHVRLSTGACSVLCLISFSHSYPVKSFAHAFAWHGG